MAHTEATKKVKKFYGKLKIVGEHLVIHQFPERIKHINELIDKPEFHIDEINIKMPLNIPSQMKKENNKCEDNTPGIPLDSTSYDTIPEKKLIPSNNIITDVIKIFKPILNQLIQDTNTLSVWVKLSIPKVEDGNNFGIDVQKEILSIISEVKNNFNLYIEQILDYYTTRAQYIRKVLKYPNLDEFRLAIEEIDTNQYVYVSLGMVDVRNAYSILHNTVIKNLDKIKNPRTSNTDSLY